VGNKLLKDLLKIKLEFDASERANLHQCLKLIKKIDTRFIENINNITYFDFCQNLNLYEIIKIDLFNKNINDVNTIKISTNIK